VSKLAYGKLAKIVVGN